MREVVPEGMTELPLDTRNACVTVDAAAVVNAPSTREPASSFPAASTWTMTYPYCVEADNPEVAVNENAPTAEIARSAATATVFA